MSARFMTSYRDPSVVMMARIISSSCYPVVPCRPGLVGPHNHPPAAPGLARSIHYMEAVHGCIVQVHSGCIGQLLQFSPCRLLTRSANLIIKVSKEFTNSTNEMQLNFNSLLSLIISLFTRLPCWKSVPPSPWSMTAMIGSRCPEEAEGGLVSRGSGPRGHWGHGRHQGVAGDGRQPQAGSRACPVFSTSVQT